MNYLKKFESANDIVEVVVVDFSGGGDALEGVYIDGDLEFYGDDYHDKISEKIGGFILGLKWIKENYIYNLKVNDRRVQCIDADLIERVTELGDSPPKKLSEVRVK